MNFYKIIPLSLIFLTSVLFGNDSNRVAIVVNDKLYPYIEDSLKTYQEDLQNEGFTPILKLWSLENQQTPQQLKSYLKNLYDEQDSLQGAVFIGDLPIAWFEHNLEDFPEVMGSPYKQTYPTDYYYMDLTSNVWADRDDNSKFDNLPYDEFSKPNIWISRIKASNIKTSYTSWLSWLKSLITGENKEAKIVNRYFKKNHEFRTGTKIFPQVNFFLLGADRRNVSHYLTNSTSPASYPIIGNTNKTDFMKLLSLGYEYAAFHAHGSPNDFTFDLDSLYVDEIIESEDITINLPLLTTMSCTIGRFTEPNYIAGIFTYKSGSKILSFITATTPQYTWNTERLVERINKKNTIGNSFKDALSYFIDFQLTQQLYLSQLNLYSKVMLGDGTLRLQRHIPNINLDGELISSHDIENTSFLHGKLEINYTRDKEKNTVTWDNIGTGNVTYKVQSLEAEDDEFIKEVVYEGPNTEYHYDDDAVGIKIEAFLLNDSQVKIKITKSKTIYFIERIIPKIRPKPIVQVGNKLILDTESFKKFFQDEHYVVVYILLGDPYGSLELEKKEYWKLEELESGIDIPEEIMNSNELYSYSYWVLIRYIRDDWSHTKKSKPHMVNKYDEL